MTMPTLNKVAQVNKELKSSLKKLHDVESIINRSPIIYCIWRFAEDAPVEYISANINQWGYTPEDFLSGKISWHGITHAEDVPRLKSEISAHVKNKRRQFDRSYRMFDSQGETRWVEDQIVFIYGNAGKITHAQSSIIDVTERNKMRQTLQETQNIYQTIFENTGTAMAIADQDRKTLLVNDKLEELTGYTKEELAGQKMNWESFIAPQDLERLKNYHRLRLTDPAAAPKHYEY
jgi:PAS domain S-box-containing protein